MGPRTVGPLTLLALLLVGWPSSTSAQTVRGRVLDENGFGIDGAVVSFLSEEGSLAARVVSDETGAFSVAEIRKGTFLISVERLGYQRTTSRLALREDEALEVELKLAVEAIPLDPITVVASPRPVWEHLEPPFLWGFREREHHYEKLGIGNFHSAEDLAPFRGQKVSQTLSDLHPFLQTMSHVYRPGTIILRGRRGCKPLIYVDGILVSPRQPIRGFDPGPTRVRGIRSQTLMPDSAGRGEESIDEFISLGLVAAVEVYRGASDLPAEFYSGMYSSDCGAVVIWSRRGVG